MELLAARLGYQETIAKSPVIPAGRIAPDVCIRRNKDCALRVLLFAIVSNSTPRFAHYFFTFDVINVSFFALFIWT